MLIPSLSSGTPKVKRSIPVTKSAPIVASNNPAATIVSELRRDPDEIMVTMTRPKRTREARSTGPKAKASVAANGPTNAMPRVDRIPAANDAKADIPKAAPARPARAIACPSMQVMMLAASPGTRIRMDVIEPPYIAP